MAGGLDLDQQEAFVEEDSLELVVGLLGDLEVEEHHVLVEEVDHLDIDQDKEQRSQLGVEEEHLEVDNLVEVELDRELVVVVEVVEDSHLVLVVVVLALELVLVVLLVMSYLVMVE